MNTPSQPTTGRPLPPPISIWPCRSCIRPMKPPIGEPTDSTLPLAGSSQALTMALRPGGMSVRRPDTTTGAPGLEA